MTQWKYTQPCKHASRRAAWTGRPQPRGSQPGTPAPLWPRCLTLPPRPSACPHERQRLLGSAQAHQSHKSMCGPDILTGHSKTVEAAGPTCCSCMPLPHAGWAVQTRANASESTAVAGLPGSAGGGRCTRTRQKTGRACTRRTHLRRGGYQPCSQTCSPALPCGRPCSL